MNSYSGRRRRAVSIGENHGCPASEKSRDEEMYKEHTHSQPGLHVACASAHTPGGRGEKADNAKTVAIVVAQSRFWLITERYQR